MFLSNESCWANCKVQILATPTRLMNTIYSRLYIRIYYMKSNCHNAPIKIQHADEGTSYYICTACNEGCDPKYKDLSEFFHDTTKEERREMLLDVIDKANKDQKDFMEKVKKKRKLEEALDLANEEIKEWEYFRDLVKSKLENLPIT